MQHCADAALAKTYKQVANSYEYIYIHILKHTVQKTLLYSATQEHSLSTYPCILNSHLFVVSVDSFMEKRKIGLLNVAAGSLNCYTRWFITP